MLSVLEEEEEEEEEETCVSKLPLMDVVGVLTLVHESIISLSTSIISVYA